MEWQEGVLVDAFLSRDWHLRMLSSKRIDLLVPVEQRIPAIYFSREFATQSRRELRGAREKNDAERTLPHRSKRRCYCAAPSPTTMKGAQYAG
jgi:hypothetical protein